jgi:predicted transcriptional regulator
MVTIRQIRAARALLGWSQQKLADKAKLGRQAVARLETGAAEPRPSTVEAVHNALRKAGIEFYSGGVRGEGVRFVNPKK